MSNDTLNQPLPQSGVPNLNPIAVRFGFIAGFIGVLTSLILYFTNQEYTSILKWLPVIFMIVIIIGGQQQMVKANSDYQISLGSLFKAGFVITILTAVFMVIYFIIYANFIEPDFVNKILDISKVEMAKKGLSEEQTESAIEMSKKFMSPVFMAIMSLISNTVIGSIASIIGAAIFKNEK